jgi:hypothetical protein
MKRLLALIAFLLALNPIVVTKDRNYFQHLMEKMRQQGIIIDKLRILAQQEASLLGRIIKFGSRDGYAIYVITKVFPRTVQIDWLNYGDGWSDARCGHQALLDIDYAKAYTDFEDHQGGVLPLPKIICPTVTASPDVLQKFMS